jgi:hypothetical protein
MSTVVKITISGRGAETDAPTVEDALDDLRDYLDILRGVEEAVSGTQQSAIDWRLVDASRRSPLAFDFQPFPKQFAVNIDQRVEIVLAETAAGLTALQARAERPRHFTNPVMRKAHRVFQRVTNGLSLSEIDFGKTLPAVRLTPTIARNAARNVDQVLTPPDKPYKEIGSVEGCINGAELDGFGRRIVHIIERISGEPVECLVTPGALPGLEVRELRDVWHYRRTEVYGRIHFRAPGKIEQIEAERVRFLRSRTDLPQIDDIIDPEFTGGLRTEEYLEKLRDGTLS